MHRADAGSEEVVLTVQQPFANHNGGQLAFGPDGYLYIGLGDGGSANDPYGNGQRMDTLLGKMLRIDVAPKAGRYAIPSSNPFVGRKDGRPEIWALGLRNPWRFSFDRRTGDLYIADVGQNKYEEVNVQPASSRGGENYGWNILEGFVCYFGPPCDDTGMTLPIDVYTHTGGPLRVQAGFANVYFFSVGILRRFFAMLAVLSMLAGTMRLGGSSSALI